MDIAELKAELETLHSASFGWALSCCRRDRGEAEDVLQTVYLKILEGKARFRGEAAFRTWLFAVIRKTAAGEYRRKLLCSLKLITGAEQPDDRASPEVGPLATFENSEVQIRFQSALKSLPARQREALHLVFYEDLMLPRAADVVGISIGSARSEERRVGKEGRLRWWADRWMNNEW